MLIVCLNS